MAHNKICHITSAHSRYDNRIFYKECQSLVSAGYEVFLLVSDTLKDEMKDGVTIISTNTNPKKRIKRFFTNNNLILSKALDIDADVYHLHDPELLKIIKPLKKNKKLVVFDSHEDYPSIILEKKWIPQKFRKFISILYSYYEKKVVNLTDGIITVTPHISERLKQNHNNVEVITNYPSKNTNLVKKEFDNSVCFVGGIQKFWNIDIIIEALSEIKSTSFRVAGQGDEKYIEYLKSLPSNGKVEFLGYLNRQQIKELYLKSSIGLCISSYRPNSNYKQGTFGNTKFFEYLSYGLPVISTDFEICKYIIDKYECGLYVSPDDVVGLKRKILKILKDPKLQKKMSENAIKAIDQEFNWEQQALKLIKFYNNLIDRFSHKNRV